MTMKIIMAISILLSFCTVGIAQSKEHDPVAVEKEKWKYEDLIIPSNGCRKDDVDKVYGHKSVVNEKPLRAPTKKPFHTYTLLSHEHGSLCKACLCVVYNEGLVEYSWIDYSYVTKGACVAMKGTPGYEEKIRNEDKEDLRMLNDLKEIYRIFKAKIDIASWNTYHYVKRIHKLRDRSLISEDSIPPPAAVKR
jgi:hypothetical protein